MAPRPKIWDPFVINTKLDESVFQSDDVLIDKSGDLIRMDTFTAWNKSHLRVAKRFRVNSLRIGHSNFAPKKRDVSFLRELRSLRALHLVADKPMDLSVVSELIQLEFLGLVGKLVSGIEDKTTAPIDFQPLRKLKASFIQLCRITETVLNCSTVESLDVWDEARESFGPGRTELRLSELIGLKSLRVTQWPKLKSFDLTAQPKLERLELYALPKLKPNEVWLHPKAQLKSLGIGGCGAYRIDWNRVGTELEELKLQGPLRFPFEDILNAPNLRRVDTNGVKTFPPLKFLLKLKKLNRFSYFSPPPGPKFSEEDRAVIEKICGRAEKGDIKPKAKTVT